MESKLPAGIEPLTVRGRSPHGGFSGMISRVEIETYQAGLELFVNLTDWLLQFPHDNPNAYEGAGIDGLWIHNGDYNQEPKTYRVVRKPGFKHDGK